MKNCIGMELPRNSEVIFQSGDFCYKFIWNWAKWPEELKGCQVSGVFCDKNDQVYVFNRTERTPIAVFFPDGTFERAFGSGLFVHPHGIFINDKGNLWCADDRGHVIREITPEGEPVRTLGTGIPSDSGYEEGVPWPKDLDTIKRAAPPFNRPTRLVEAPWGELYASDGYANASIHRFSADGTLLQTWGGCGTEPGHFKLPHGIWADIRERIWVTDRENNRTQIFTKEGGFITSFDRMLYPSEIWSDNEKYVYVSEAYGGMTVFDMDLKIVAQIGHYMSQIYAHSICGDRKGNIYFGMIDGVWNLAKMERI